MPKTTSEDDFERAGICLGPSFIRKLDDYTIVRGTSRREELIRLLDLGASLPNKPPVREDKYLEDMGRDGVLTIKAPIFWWEGLRKLAVERDETLSATARAYMDAGLAHPDAGFDDPKPTLHRAKRFLRAAPAAKPGEIGAHLWPAARRAVHKHAEGVLSTSPTGRARGWNGVYAAKIVRNRLEEKSP
ncbi:MAG: hypothetical protein GY871_04655 [Actinomycetales bacterium]|nr:hypothetical protein [Actinomycetales bacterium]